MTPERLEAIAAVDPQHATVHIYRGVAQWRRGHLEEALAELEQVLSSDPEQWDPYLDKQFDPYFWKGMICASLRRDEEAIAAIEKSLELELPPILLTPLRWFEHDRPDFYQKYVVPLMARYDLW